MGARVTASPIQGFHGLRYRVETYSKFSPPHPMNSVILLSKFTNYCQRQLQCIPHPLHTFTWQPSPDFYAVSQNAYFHGCYQCY